MEQRSRARRLRDALDRGIGRRASRCLPMPAAAGARHTHRDRRRPQALSGQSIAYEQVRGRAFGELDPTDAHNAIVTDLQLAKDPADGKVRITRRASC